MRTAVAWRRAARLTAAVVLGAALELGSLLAAGAWPGPVLAAPAEGGSQAWPPPTPEATEVAVTEAQALEVVRLSEPLATDNPFSPQWKQAPYVSVPMLPQNVTMPAVNETAVGTVRAQTLRDGERIAIRVSWADETPDGNVNVSRFTDAVAVGFPVDANASPMMGQADGRMQILHWKALWQKDVDVGFQDVQDLYPNYWADLYWFAEGEFPFPLPEAFQSPESLQWFVAERAGNPMAVFSRTQPAEELVAEGWGSLTHQENAVTSAKGAWAEGRWAVVFTRPLQTDDPLDYQFQPGGSGQMNFAVWDGAAGNVGGRKQWSNWVPFTVQQ